MVVIFQLGRLKNIAPVDKSKLRNCVDFLGAWVAPGTLFGMLLKRLLGSCGTPWEALGFTLGHLGVTLGPLGMLGGAPGCFWDPMLPDLAVFLQSWA